MRESDATREHRQRIAKLTAVELEVLILTARGLDLGAVAEARGVLKSTVRTQRQSLMAKLGVKTLIEAAVIAAKAGLV